jgi:YD repeat-containing protein
MTSGRRRAASVVAVTTVLMLGVSLAPGAAAAERAISQAEREAWSAEERREHGQKFADGIEVPEDIEPAEARDSESSPVPPLDPQAITTETVTSEGDSPDPSFRDLEPGRVVLDVAGKRRAVGHAGDLPVVASAVKADGARKSNPGRVRVEVLAEDTADRTGVKGLLLKVTGGDGATDSGAVELSVDISGVTGPADWASRARLVELPACALTRPQDADCQQQTEVPVQERDGDVLTGRLDVSSSQDGVAEQNSSSDAAPTRSPLAAERVASQQVEQQATVLAVTAGASGADGDWSASSLNASAAWGTSGNTGGFTWSYPMRTPQTPGGLHPDVSLNYDSSGLDGKVASANSQAGEIGDGWQLTTGGYIERSYVPCSEDQAAVGGQSPNNANRDTGDLCWKSDNATMVLAGHAGQLIQDGSSNTFRLENDDNTKVERLTGAWNQDNDKEYWKVTTTDGTQYWFGRDQRSASDTRALSSAWTVPVYGNHPGEPCYNASYGASRCTQAWRWNLDYVVDPLGNSMTYVYTSEPNRYGYNNNAGTASYIRGGFLRWIEYGTRAGSEASSSAPARIGFTPAERCRVTDAFDCGVSKISSNPNKWPDVPADLICDSTTSCAQVQSPAFFSRKRTTMVNTQVRTGASSYKTVDRWTLDQSFPDPGGGTGKQLWLNSIQHAGLAADASADNVTLPLVEFTGRALDNRVDSISDYGSTMARFRLNRIHSEAGGITSIYYGDQDCGPGDKPGSSTAAIASNTRACMPVYWTPAGFSNPQLEWFHKYRVTDVAEDPRGNGSVVKETHYTYSGDAGWRYDDNEFVRPKQRTWSQWRGYSRVDVRTGEPGASAEPQLRTSTRYFRGLHADRDGSGETKSVKVDGIDDLDQYAGMTRQESTYNGSDITETTFTTPWRSSATATNSLGDKAYYTGVQSAETQTTLSSGGTRTMRTDTTFDPRGRVWKVSERGDTSKSGDERCITTTYADNTGKNLLETVRDITTLGVRCDQTAVLPADLVSLVRYAYDGGSFTATPDKGLVTQTQEAGSHNGTAPSWVTVETVGYDAFGRQISSADALGRTTTTAYTETNGLNTKTVVTSPDPDGSGPLTAHVTTTALDPAFGNPTAITNAGGSTTRGQYDGLGRLTGVWEPGRVPGTDSANTLFEYEVRSTGVNAVVTKTLNWDGSARVTSTKLLDGLLRERQTQTPSADRDTPGRVLTDTVYDSRGLPWRTVERRFVTGAPSTSIVALPGQNMSEAPAWTQTRFDGAGRPVKSEQFGGADPLWSTTTSYGGDRVTVTPPNGGTPTTTITDARGNTIELRQFKGGSPSGAYTSTTYQWDDADRLIGAADDAGNSWTYGYDLRGRQTSASDPDKGTTLTAYDNAGQVTSTTDARGKTLAYVYDALGRKTGMHEGSPTGTLRASWKFDTLQKGQISASSRFEGGAEWITGVTGYDARGLPTGQTITIPSTDATAAIAGTFKTKMTFTVDRRLRGGGGAAAGGPGGGARGWWGGGGGAGPAPPPRPRSSPSSG